MAIFGPTSPPGIAAEISCYDDPTSLSVSRWSPTSSCWSLGLLGYAFFSSTGPRSSSRMEGSLTFRGRGEMTMALPHLLAFLGTTEALRFETVNHLLRELRVWRVVEPTAGFESSAKLEEVSGHFSLRAPTQQSAFDSIPFPPSPSPALAQSWYVETPSSHTATPRSWPPGSLRGLGATQLGGTCGGIGFTLFSFVRKFCRCSL